jgi:hypothetical protein
LSFLQELYVKSKYDLMTVGKTHQQVKDMLNTADPLRKLGIRKLESSGLIDSEENTITTMGATFALVIFPADLLTPEAIGKKGYSGRFVEICYYSNPSDVGTMIYRQLEEIFYAAQIKSSIHLLSKKYLHLTLHCSGVVLIVDSTPILPDTLECLTKLIAKNVPLFRVNINKGAESTKIDGIKFSEEITIASSTELEVKKQLEKVVPDILARYKQD